jgi:NADH:ubiquinone oxidoreductase subunit C
MADDDTRAREEVHEDAGDAEPGGPEVPSDEVAAAVVAEFPEVVFADSHGQAVLHVAPALWHDVAAFLRDEQQFTQCVDVTAVDQLVASTRSVPAGVTADRFEVVANFLSHPRNRRIRVIAQLPGDEPTVASLTDLYPGVNFAEREAYDLLGVIFEGHPDLTRIQMPDDWIGHPLRKDDAPARVPVTFKGDPSPR